MDVAILSRSVRRSPSARRGACVVAVLLAAATASADTTASRFDAQAALEASPVVPAGNGFEVHAQLAPLRKTVEGGDYAIDAVVAPSGVCSGGGDIIFENGFESLMR
jgi:hypothetical protein